MGYKFSTAEENWILFGHNQKRENGPGAYRRQEKFPRANTFVCRFSFFIIFPGAHATGSSSCVRHHVTVIPEAMRRWMKRLLGNIAAGSFSRALHE